MLPDFDSLALFVRAAELRSLTKAADASHIGLAAASRRIALLEHRFKAALLERSPKGVDLTPAGASLLVHAKALLMQVNHMQAEMNDHASGRAGALRVLANTSAMTEHLPSDLAAFSRLHPGLKMSVEERWSAEIVKAVLTAEADVGIIVEGTHAEGVDLIAYRTDWLAVVTPNNHELTRVENLRFVDIVDHDIVALESGSSMMRLLAEQAIVSEKTLQLRVQVRSFEAVCRMVEAGLGVGILPLQAANALAGAMGLFVRKLQEPWAERRMLICVRPERNTSGSVAMLVKHLASAGGTVDHLVPD
jgi:DNA-binding transcriptional LysR family regulator